VSLQKAKELVSVLNDGIQRIALGTPWEDPVVPTQHLAANADALLPKPHEEHGSMEGRLETLSVHGGSTFAIWDAMSGQRIECHFPSTMLPEAQEAFNRRVLVSGIIRYSSEGRAKSIIVEKLRPLRGQEELPQIDAIQPINITDGTDSAEYVRRLRDANPEGLLGHLPLHRSTAADARTH
jgi:hypothetical protein